MTDPADRRAGADLLADALHRVGHAAFVAPDAERTGVYRVRGYPDRTLVATWLGEPPWALHLYERGAAEPIEYLFGQTGIDGLAAAIHAWASAPGAPCRAPNSVWMGDQPPPADFRPLTCELATDDGHLLDGAGGLPAHCARDGRRAIVWQQPGAMWPDDPAALLRQRRDPPAAVVRITGVDQPSPSAHVRITGTRLGGDLAATWWTMPAGHPCPLCGHERGAHPGPDGRNGVCEVGAGDGVPCGCTGP